MLTLTSMTCAHVDIVEKTKMLDLRYTYYNITEKGLKCIKEDVKIMSSLSDIEKHLSSK
jgi:hypothetical protein